MTDINPRHTRPDGFELLGHQSRFSLHLGQLYVSRPESPDNAILLGLKLEEPHTGGPGNGHGGMTMTLLDETMGRAASEAVGKTCVTISMTTNFCAPTKIGDFVYARAVIKRRGQNLVFVDAELRAGNVLLATATGTWMNTGHPIPGKE